MSPLNATGRNATIPYPSPEAEDDEREMVNALRRVRRHANPGALARRLALQASDAAHKARLAGFDAPTRARLTGRAVTLTALAARL